MRAFAKAGSQLRLEELDLRMNHLPPSTIAELGLAVRQKGCLAFLRVLDLRQNLIGSEGAKAIAHAVLAGGFAVLEKLYVQRNEIFDQGATALFKAFTAEKVMSPNIQCVNVVSARVTCRRACV